MSNRALGILETRGMAALMAAADAMLKRAEVSLCGRQGIGTGWLTLLIEGETAPVNAALRVGVAAARQHGEVIFERVVPLPEHRAVAAMPHDREICQRRADDGLAVGLLETQGVTPLMVGTDAMADAADVEIAGWTYIGGALSHVLVRGEVASVQAALAAGQEAACRAGDLHASLVLPQPHPAVAALYPPPPAGQPQAAGDRVVGALGVVESTGYAGSVAAVDGMIKMASVDVVRLAIGSGGRVAALVTGPLADVTAAVEAGASAAADAAECNGQAVISGPDAQTMACFAHVEATPRRVAPEPPRHALGLLETRSTIGLVMGVDEMLKNAEVEFEGRHKVGYFLTAAVIRGDVGAVQLALDRGAEVARQYGELVAAHLIALPFSEMEERLPHA